MLYDPDYPAREPELSSAAVMIIKYNHKTQTAGRAGQNGTIVRGWWVEAPVILSLVFLHTGEDVHAQTRAQCLMFTL